MSLFFAGRCTAATLCCDVRWGVGDGEGGNGDG